MHEGTRTGSITYSARTAGVGARSHVTAAHGPAAKGRAVHASPLRRVIAGTARLPAGLVPRLRRILFRLEEAAHPGSADAPGEGGFSVMVAAPCSARAAER